MKSAPFFLAALSVASLASASAIGHDSALSRRSHKHMSRNQPGLNSTIERRLSRRRESKRCKPREEPKPNTGNVNLDAGNHSGGGDNVFEGVSGLIKVTTGTCGAPQASKKITATGGPNGAQWWLNCGIDDGGWNPPDVGIDDIVTVNLDDAVDTFAPCADYIWIFDKYGGEFGIPPIMIASFAMQESTCNADLIGRAGEMGMMQLTPDKCGGAPGGNCLDPEFNIRTGAKFFADILKQYNGNVLLAAGHYNGWFAKMTKADATAAASTACCNCQQNLDYLHQLFNGWLQGKNAYDNTLRLGSYFNLDVCNK